MQSKQLVGVATGVGNIMRAVKPDQLDSLTPCRDWRVRTLVNHLLQVISALSLAGRGEAVPDELWERDLMAGGWSERYDDESARAIAAWDERPEPGGNVRLGSAEMPAAVVLVMLASDLVIHGWDLARATGQEYSCEDEAAGAAHRFLIETGEQGREMGLYAEAVPVAEDAPVLHRALGLSGRNPYWTP